MKIITPETSKEIYDKHIRNNSVFLGGTIDNGSSVDWQEELGQILIKNNLYIYNPRRKNWDSGAGEKAIEEQILWELDAQERCDVLAYNILGDSKSPITLMEIGAYKYKNILVNCSKDFYRYTNVKTFCEYYSIPLFDISIDDFASEIVDIFDELI